MKYQIGEQVWVKSKDIIEIISEIEQIAGQNIYYTFDGNSYGEKEIDKYGFYYGIINKILNKIDFSVKVLRPERLETKNINKRLEDALLKVKMGKNTKLK